LAPHSLDEFKIRRPQRQNAPLNLIVWRNWNDRRSECCRRRVASFDDSDPLTQDRIGFSNPTADFVSNFRYRRLIVATHVSPAAQKLFYGTLANPTGDALIHGNFVAAVHYG
jgi:hypothetical protein